jgi:hypothetical protein
MTVRLGELGVPVKLAITLDPAFHQTASPRVSNKLHNAYCFPPHRAKNGPVVRPGVASTALG